MDKYCKSDRPQMTIWCMRIACWIPRVTNTYCEYVMVFHCNSGCMNGSQCYMYVACPVYQLHCMQFTPLLNKKTLHGYSSSPIMVESSSCSVDSC